MDKGRKTDEVNSQSAEMLTHVLNFVGAARPDLSTRKQTSCLVWFSIQTTDQLDKEIVRFAAQQMFRRFITEDVVRIFCSYALPVHEKFSNEVQSTLSNSNPLGDRKNVRIT